MDELRIPIECRADESRAGPGRIVGELLTYEARALDRAEVFREGALVWEDRGVVLNVQHDRQQPITRFVPTVEGRAVKIDAPLPDTQRAGYRDPDPRRHHDGPIRRIPGACRGAAERGAGNPLGKACWGGRGRLAVARYQRRNPGPREAEARMAVTVTAAELAAALRLGDSTEETAEAARLLSYATTAVTKHAPDAPDAAHNEAAIVLAAHLFDKPTAARRDSYSNSLRFSGAAAILLPYRVHRAGSTGGAAADEAAPRTTPQTDTQQWSRNMPDLPSVRFCFSNWRSRTLPP